jgi:hypothetical protein
MSTQIQQYESNIPNFPLYEELKERAKNIPSTLSAGQMRRIISNKYITFRAEGKQFADLCIITYVVMLRFYHGRHEDVKNSKFLSMYKCKTGPKSVRFELDNVPDRLVKMIYALVDSIKSKD